MPEALIHQGRRAPSSRPDTTQFHTCLAARRGAAQVLITPKAALAPVRPGEGHITKSVPRGDATGPKPLKVRETDGRGARIRTGDLLRPRQARYQAAPRPDEHDS